MARFAVKIEGKERIVEIDEGAKPRVDGMEVDVEVVAADAGSWILRRDGEQTFAWVDGSGARMTVEVRRAGEDPVVLGVEVGDTSIV